MGKLIIDPKDKRYFIEKPDKDFSPQRNQAVIAETIAETTKYFAQLAEIMDDDLGNRLDVLSSYGKYRLGGSQYKNFKDWAGKKLHDELIGEKILQKVRIAESTNKLQGNRKNSILI